MISANRSPILAIWQLPITESQSSGVIATIIWTLHFSRSFIELHSCWNAAPILHYVLYAILLCSVNGFLSYLNLFHKIPQMCAITMLCLRKKFDTPNWASSAKKKHFGAVWHYIYVAQQSIKYIKIFYKQTKHVTEILIGIWWNSIKIQFAFFINF